MNDAEVREKYGISKRMGIMLFIQLVLVTIALAITLVGIFKSVATQRTIIYCGQAITCVVIIGFGFLKFKKKERKYVKYVIYSYGVLEALRAALLSTTGIDPAIGATCRFLLVILACNCVLLANNLEYYRSEKISMALVVWESILYILYLFKFPGVMSGYINRLLPFAGVLIAGSVALYIKAQNEQLGVDIMAKTTIGKWQTLSIVGLCIIFVVMSLIAASITRYNQLKEAREAIEMESLIEESKENDVLQLIKPVDLFACWKSESKVKSDIIKYMATITDRTSAQYIPPKDRIAVFDLDGTIMCENYPTAFSYVLYNYRVLEDSSYKNKATSAQKAVADKIKKYTKEGVFPDDFYTEFYQAFTEVFAGKKVSDFTDYVRMVRDMPAEGFSDMTRKEAFYQPMLQLIKYFESNEFKIYIVSSTDRIVIRGLIEDVIDIPEDRIIGSDFVLVTQNQNETEGYAYSFMEGDRIILGGKPLYLNREMNKVMAVEREIGQKPVLVFGNSSGDFSLAQYVKTDNKYISLAFMVCNDDADRERGNPQAVEELYSKCNEFEWIPISMKDDWEIIYK